jgi:hypothetical protein
MSRQRLETILDLDRYPIDRLDGPEGSALVAECRRLLERDGMFNLDRLIRSPALGELVAELLPVLHSAAFTHARRHNIYFRKSVEGLPPDHPALAPLDTVNHTVCADQIPGSALVTIYEWPPLAAFLAAVMDKPALHVMADPLARLNVMAYRDGEALNWHFDRSEFTTTLLLQAPEAGGEFEYRTGLRSEGDPNYDGVARLLRGADLEVRQQPLSSGTLNVFRGRNTAHRVTPVRGQRERVIAVFSYYERPGVMFSVEERVGFYGRAS